MRCEDSPPFPSISKETIRRWLPEAAKQSRHDGSCAVFPPQLRLTAANQARTPDITGSVERCQTICYLSTSIGRERAHRRRAALHVPTQRLSTGGLSRRRRETNSPLAPNDMPDEHCGANIKKTIGEIENRPIE